MPTAPEIPLDIKEMLHDCIMSVFWPRRKIIEFFNSVGCPDRITEAVCIEGDNSLSRHEVIVEVFSQLSKRGDGGFQIFQSMIDRMSNWDYFDPYWFDKQKKLDKADSKQLISQFKSAVENRNRATIRQRKTASSVKSAGRKEMELDTLKKGFQNMFGEKMSPQARGRFFEKFLQTVFNQQSIKMAEAFRINGEQIDGTFKFEGENYIVEAKWQDPSTSTEQLYHFAQKVDGKMHGRGIFISVNSFSREAIRAIVHGKHIKTILVDGEDINYVLEGLITLEKMLDNKIRAAQTRGEVYICAIKGTEKV